MILFTGQLFIKVKYNNIKTKILIKAPDLLRRLYAREKNANKAKRVEILDLVIQWMS